jgi:hypothetical protein
MPTDPRLVSHASASDRSTMRLFSRDEGAVCLPRPAPVHDSLVRCLGRDRAIFPARPSTRGENQPLPGLKHAPVQTPHPRYLPRKIHQPRATHPCFRIRSQEKPHQGTSESQPPAAKRTRTDEVYQRRCQWRVDNMQLVEVIKEYANLVGALFLLLDCMRATLLSLWGSLHFNPQSYLHKLVLPP